MGDPQWKRRLEFTVVVLIDMDVDLGIPTLVLPPLYMLSPPSPSSHRKKKHVEASGEDSYSGKKFVLQMSFSSEAQVK